MFPYRVSLNGFVMDWLVFFTTFKLKAHI